MINTKNTQIDWIFEDEEIDENNTIQNQELTISNLFSVKDEDRLKEVCKDFDFNVEYNDIWKSYYIRTDKFNWTTTTDEVNKRIGYEKYGENHYELIDVLSELIIDGQNVIITTIDKSNNNINTSTMVFDNNGYFDFFDTSIVQ
jgi:hypothetical protein